MAKQLTFDLPSEPALQREDFFVAPSNAAAVEAVQSWHDWPLGKLVLAGPTGSGKTHLAHVWAGMTGARIVAAGDLVTDAVADLAAGPVAVEDVDRIAGQDVAERALFHLHNLVLETGHPLLLTAASPPARWKLQLRDLASRMQGSALVSLSPPDDALLTAVLMKLFADRQLAVTPAVIAWLTKRIGRSFAEAGRVVEALDAAALHDRRAITTDLARRVLDKLDDSGP